MIETIKNADRYTAQGTDGKVWTINIPVREERKDDGTYKREFVVQGAINLGKVATRELMELAVRQLCANQFKAWFKAQTPDANSVVRVDIDARELLDELAATARVKAPADPVKAVDKAIDAMSDDQLAALIAKAQAKRNAAKKAAQ